MAGVGIFYIFIFELLSVFCTLPNPFYLRQDPGSGAVQFMSVVPDVKVKASSIDIDHRFARLQLALRGL